MFSKGIFGCPRGILLAVAVSLLLLVAGVPAGPFGAACLGADIDQAILNGDQDYYKKLLSQITANGSKNENVLLQKTLLKRLIYFSTKRPEDKIEVPSPSSIKEYLGLFRKYLAWSRARNELEAKIEDTQDKLLILKRQISALPKDDPALLTLQLQYAFYKKGLEFFKASLSATNNAMDETPKALVDALGRIKIDEAALPKRLEKIDSELDKLEARIQARKIEVEQLNLLEKQDAIARIQDTIQKLQAQRQDLLEDKIEALFAKFSAELARKDKSVFKTGTRIVKVAGQLEDGDVVAQDIAELIDTMETLVLGKARTFHGQTVQEIKLMLSRFYQTINAPIFSINGTPVSILKLVMALVVFVMGFFVGNFYKRNVSRLSLSSRTLTPATRTLLANLGYYAIVTFGFLTGLKVVGIDLSSFALVAGALSVGIGFGLQNIVSNLVSGIILMFERSVKIGDYIEFDERLRGRVVDLRMRSMTITTNANINVIVPNQDFIQNRVINWTMNDDIRRFDIPFGVAYGTDPDRVMDVVMNAVKKCGYPELYSSSRRRHSVIMVGMGDSSVDFHLRVWIKGPSIMKPRRTASKFLLLVYKALNEAGIEIPFPQRDLHLRSVEADIGLRIRKDGEERLGGGEGEGPAETSG